MGKTRSAPLRRLVGVSRRLSYTGSQSQPLLDRYRSFVAAAKAMHYKSRRQPVLH